VSQPPSHAAHAVAHPLCFTTAGGTNTAFQPGRCTCVCCCCPCPTPSNVSLTPPRLQVAVLSGDEQRYLEAQLAYNAGKPIMSDADFDALKVQLPQTNSVVTAPGPRRSLRRPKVASGAALDYLKLTLINLPAALVVRGTGSVHRCHGLRSAFCSQGGEACLP